MAKNKRKAGTEEMETISFRLSANAARALRKLKNHTKVVQSVVMKSLGCCPTCGGHWRAKPNKKEAA